MRLKRLMEAQRLVTGWVDAGSFGQGFLNLGSLKSGLDAISRGATVYTDYQASKTMQLQLAGKYGMALVGQLASDLHFVFTSFGEKQPDLSSKSGTATIVVTRNSFGCYLVLTEDRQSLKEIVFVRGEETYGKELAVAFRWNDANGTFSR